jgi:hypothetical protein
MLKRFLGDAAQQPFRHLRRLLHLGAEVRSEPDVDRVYVAFVIGFGLGFRERSLRQRADLAFHPPDLLRILTDRLSQQEQQTILIHQVLELAVASPHLDRSGRGRVASRIGDQAPVPDQIERLRGRHRVQPAAAGRHRDRAHENQLRV